MSDAATGKSGKTWLYVVGILASLPLLYVLSVGPSTVFLGRSALTPSVGSVGPSVGSVFYTAYDPLFWFADMTETKPMLKAYMTAWVRFTSDAKNTDFMGY